MVDQSEYYKSKKGKFGIKLTSESSSDDDKVDSKSSSSVASPTAKD